MRVKHRENCLFQRTFTPSHHWRKRVCVVDLNWKLQIHYFPILYDNIFVGWPEMLILRESMPKRVGAGSSWMKRNGCLMSCVLSRSAYNINMNFLQFNDAMHNLVFCVGERCWQITQQSSSNENTQQKEHLEIFSACWNVKAHNVIRNILKWQWDQLIAVWSGTR